MRCSISIGGQNIEGASLWDNGGQGRVARHQDAEQEKGSGMDHQRGDVMLHTLLASGHFKLTKDSLCLVKPQTPFRMSLKTMYDKLCINRSPSIKPAQYFCPAPS